MRTDDPTPSVAPRRGPAAGAIVILGVALFPMALTTLLFLASIGKECTPGHGGRWTDELMGIAIIWFVFAVPAVPTFMMAQPGKTTVAHGVGVVLLACVALVVALLTVPMAALAHMC